jgi:OmpA-OmpF porin, OOP family
MNATTKIILGALATTAIAWWLNGPMGFGSRCAASAAAVPAAVATATEAPASIEAVAGCQEKVTAAMTGKTINFATAGSAIAADSSVLLDTIATNLKDCAGTTVEVSGHTDHAGRDDSNQRLSEARANSVVEALVARGVPVGRLTPKGYGETKPIDPAATREAYAKNRRIEFSVNASGAAAPAGSQ